MQHEFAVVGAGLLEFGVGAAGEEAALVEDVDGIGAEDGGEAVCDDETGAVASQSFEGLLDEVLGFGIDGRSGLIEEQNGRILQKGACDGDALTLASAEKDAAFANFGIEAVWQRADEVFGTRVAQSEPQIGLGGIRASKMKVLTNGSGEKEAFLRHIRDGAAQRGFAERGDVRAIECDAAALRLVEAHEQLKQRAFAAAGRADDGHGLACFGAQRDLVQNFAFGRVAEADGLKGHFAANLGIWEFSAGLQIFGRFILQERKDAFRGREAVEQRLVHAVKSADGLIKEADEQNELHELPGAHLTVHAPRRASHEQRDEAQIAEQGHRG